MGLAKKDVFADLGTIWRANLIPNCRESMMNNNGMKFLAHQKGAGGPTANNRTKERKR